MLFYTRIVLDVEPEIKNRLKIRAAEENRTMKEYVTQLIIESLNKPAKKKQTKKKESKMT